LARGETALNYIISGLSTPTRPARMEGVVTGDETDEQMAAMRAANAARREAEMVETERLRSERRESRRSERVRRSPSLPEIGRGLRKSPERVNEATLPYVDEDDLPETPEALRQQLEVEDTPPRGILFSSPSKRQKKRRNRFKEPVTVSDEVTADATRVEEPQAPQAPQAVRQMPAPVDSELVAKEEEKARLQKELESLRDEVVRYNRILKDLDSDNRDENVANMEEVM
jgi:hypothetical protein